MARDGQRVGVLLVWFDGSNARVAMPSSDSPTAPKTLRSRSWLGRATWSLVVTVVLFAAYEGTAYWGFSRTLQRLETSADRHRQKKEVMSSSEIAGQTAGLCRRSESAGRLIKTIGLEWPSVLGSYLIRVDAGLDDGVKRIQAVSTRAELSEPFPVIRTVATVEGNVVIAEPPAGTSPILLRELARQAFLLAAYEDFGLPFRDTVLGEKASFIESGSNWPFMVALQNDTDGDKLRFAVNRLTPISTDVIFEQIVTAPVGERIATATAEIFACSKKELAIALEGIGWRRSTSRVLPDGESPLSERTRLLLDEGDPLSGLLAIQDLHEQLQSLGDSPTLRCALARAYAELGTSTACSVGPQSKVFWARGLLAAESAVTRWPQRAETWYTRSFVRAHLGLLAAATRDYETGLQAEVQSPVPSWANLIPVLCRCERELLADNFTDATIHDALLRLIAADSYGTKVQRSAVAEAVLSKFPRCLRAIHTLIRLRNVGTGHVVLEKGKPCMDAILRAYVKNSKHLPQSLSKQADMSSSFSIDQLFNGDMRLNRLLVNHIEIESREPQDDTWQRGVTAALETTELMAANGAPNSQAAATIIIDLYFTQALSELVHERLVWSVDTGDSIARWKALLKDHRLLKSLDALRQPVDETVSDAIRSLTGQLATVELGTGGIGLLNLSQVDYSMWGQAEKAIAQRDEILPDLVMPELEEYDRPNLPWRARVFAKLAPDHPQGVVTRIGVEWKTIEKRLGDFEIQYQDQPEVLHELARQYWFLERYRDAVRCLERENHLRPNSEAHFWLADLYKLLGEPERRRQVLVACMQLDSVGLETSSAAQKIAYDYMDKLEFKKALPFAMSAAQSYSGNGLMVASECLEGLRRFEESEEIIRALSTRYDSSADDWYRWCCRTGRGDLRAAEQLLGKLPAPTQENQKAERRFLQTLQAEMENDFQRAYDLTLENLAADKIKPNPCLRAAIYADALGKPEERDKWLKSLDDGERAIGFQWYLAQAVLRALADKSRIPSDIELDYYATVNLNEDTALEAAYFAGQFLLILKETERAKKWLIRAASSPQYNSINRDLAAVALRRLGVELPKRLPVSSGVENVERIQALSEARVLWNSTQGSWKAISRSRQVVADYPDWPFATNLLASMFRDSSRPREALGWYSRLIELVPEQPDCYRWRASARMDLHDYRGGLEDARKSAAMALQTSISHAELAWYLAMAPEIELCDFDEALRLAEPLSGYKWSGQYTALLAKSAALAGLGKFDEAIKVQEVAIKAADESKAQEAREGLKVLKNKKRLVWNSTPSQLLEVLPPDPVTAIYQVRLVVNGETTTHQLQVRCERRYLSENGPCLQPIELKVVDSSGPLKLAKYSWEQPFRNLVDAKLNLNEEVKLTVVADEGPIETHSGFAEIPLLKFLLQGADAEWIQQSGTKEIEVGGKRFDCVVCSGHSISNESTSFPKAEWTFWRHSDVPFYLAGGTCRLTLSGDNIVDAELVLKEFKIEEPPAREKGITGNQL